MLGITRFDTSSVPPPGLVASEHRLARIKRGLRACAYPACSCSRHVFRDREKRVLARDNTPLPVSMTCSTNCSNCSLLLTLLIFKLQATHFWQVRAKNWMTYNIMWQPAVAGWMCACMLLIRKFNFRDLVLQADYIVAVLFTRRAWAAILISFVFEQDRQG